MDTQNFGHIHPVVFNEDHSNETQNAICSRCGVAVSGSSFSCAECNFSLHKKCAEAPATIDHPFHRKHPLALQPIFLQDGNKEVDNVKCAKDGGYDVIKANEKFDDDVVSVNPITRVVERNASGEMTRIRHISHAHDLILSHNTMMANDKTCDGCVLLISSSFYYCSSQCDFFLHKSCAELPGKKPLWSHGHLRPLVLVVGYIFKCSDCDRECSGFSYTCTQCDVHYCIRCSTGGYRITHPGHEHPLFYVRKHEEGCCDACGDDISWKGGKYRCKRCEFTLHRFCSMLPLIIRHKSDEHPLALTYQEGNDYSEYLWCDICEKERDPNIWFYHCATCDFSAHIMCVLGSYELIKPGSRYKGEDHEHPLVFVRKAYSYPDECDKCKKHCQDLALECAESTCNNYIVHWKCVKPTFLYRRPVELYRIQADVIPDEPRIIENKVDE